MTILFLLNIVEFQLQVTAHQCECVKIRLSSRGRLVFGHGSYTGILEYSQHRKKNLVLCLLLEIMSM